VPGRLERSGGGSVRYRALAIEGAWEVTPRQFGDPRGVFLEWFKDGPFSEAVGHRLALAQANLSVSAAGVVRGIHFTDVPPGQAKYITCPKGAAFDVVIDLRVGSPTFGRWDAVILDDIDRRAVFMSEGLGHAFQSLEDSTTIVYLCSTPYSPNSEHCVHPRDTEVGIEWPTLARDGSLLTPILSDKDTTAPTLAEARTSGLLPRLETVLDYRRSL
jgi:dTDP-4-dehydrorhamnose 3,5-epimerase